MYQDVRATYKALHCSGIVMGCVNAETGSA